MARELLFDAGACRHHMTGFTSVDVEICGICIAACPYSLRH
jgi:Fe-S-cluster-containing dehydrogenase component